MGRLAKSWRMSEEIKGLQLFQDVFRRADKNDDNQIDLAEFESFFGDDRISKQDLKQFFEECDLNKDKAIDLDELIKFFGDNDVGQNYAPLFATIQSLHMQFNNALKASHAMHTAKADTKQLFRERFFLRELAHQLESLQTIAEASLRGVASLSKEV